MFSQRDIYAAERLAIETINDYRVRGYKDPAIIEKVATSEYILPQPLHRPHCARYDLPSDINILVKNTILYKLASKLY